MTSTLQLIDGLRSAFQDQANAKLSQSLLEKCAGICKANNLNAQDMATHWEAFALNRDLDVPTDKLLDDLGDQLRRQVVANANKIKRESSQNTSSPLALRQTGASRRVLMNKNGMNNQDTKMLNANDIGIGKALPKSVTPGRTAVVSGVKREAPGSNDSFAKAFGVSVAQANARAHNNSPGTFNTTSPLSKQFNRNGAAAAAVTPNRPSKNARYNINTMSPLSGMGDSVAGGLTPSQRYSSRTNAGEVVTTFNDKLLLPLRNSEAAATGTTTSSTGADSLVSRAEVSTLMPVPGATSRELDDDSDSVGGHENEEEEKNANQQRDVIVLPAADVSDHRKGGTNSTVADKTSSKYMYMYSTLDAKAAVLDAQIDDACMKFAHQLEMDVEDVDVVGEPSQDEIFLCGRVCCEAEGKLNLKSVVLEGSVSNCGGRRVTLDLTSCAVDLDTIALFPGQLVMVRGMSPLGHTIVVKQIYSDLSPPKPSEGLRTQLNERCRHSQRDIGPMSILTAAGPYTLNDNLDFEPLEDLLAVLGDSSSSSAATNTPPCVLLLMGPFVDAHHPMIASGSPTKEFTAEDGTVQDVVLSFQDVYSLFFSRLANALEQQAGGCVVVLVPSPDDIGHVPAFPQPPLDQSHLDVFPDTSRVVLASNPCTLAINDLIIGVTSQDVVMNIVQEEAFRAGSNAPKPNELISAGRHRPDRMVRVMRHLIKQRSYYPVFPPAAEACVDVTLGERLLMPVVPDVLVCVSKLVPFVRDVDGTVALNPGRLCKGAMGGLFARLNVLPRAVAVAASAYAVSAVGGVTKEVKAVDRVHVQLVRV